GRDDHALLQQQRALPDGVPLRVVRLYRRRPRWDRQSGRRRRRRSVHRHRLGPERWLHEGVHLRLGCPVDALRHLRRAGDRDDLSTQRTAGRANRGQGVMTSAALARNAGVVHTEELEPEQRTDWRKVGWFAVAVAAAFVYPIFDKAIGIGWIG